MAINPIFFYGTLRHVPLLEVVLGRSAAHLNLTQAYLPDHAVYWVQDQPFPMITQTAGHVAKGVLLYDATPEDIARLDYYEGGFAYDLREVMALGPEDLQHPAQVYVPVSELPKGDLWSLTDWVAAWGDINLIAARDAMEHFGTWSAQDLAIKLPMMRRRADAARAARLRRPQDTPTHARHAEILSRTRVHSHFFALDQVNVRHERYDGTLTPPLDREVFFAGHAAVVLPYDPVRDEVVLVEQFRTNLFALGDPNPWVIEAVAGLVDPGETPEAAALREAEEAAGVHVTRIEQASAAYVSAGSTTEFITSFLALADFGTLTDGGGIESEGEDIRRIVMPFDTFAEGLRTHRFRAGPLVSLGFWLMLNRDRLRGSA